MTRVATVALLLLSLVSPPVRADEPSAVALEQSVASFKAGDFRAAEPLLARLHAQSPGNLDVTLLLGITEYSLHRLLLAEPLLRAAAASSDAETAVSARIFLGLLADERGDADAAAETLRQVARSAPPALAETGRALVAHLRPRRISLSFLLRPEFDSNVPLLPIAPTAQSPAGQRADGDVLMLFSLSVRPFRAFGLTLDEAASYRQQLTLLDYNLFANNVGPTYAYLGRNDRVSVGYSFEVMTLGRVLLDLGHAADAAYRRRLVAELGLGLRYTFRYRDYFAGGYESFSGPSHTGVVEVSWGTAERPFEIGAGYLVVRESTVDPTFTATGHGGRLRVRGHFARILDLGLTGWAIHRAFDVADATLGPRVDTQLFADLSLTLDLTRHIGLLVGGSVLRNLSTVADFDYLKLTAHMGLALGYAGL